MIKCFFILLFLSLWTGQALAGVQCLYGLQLAGAPLHLLAAEMPHGVLPRASLAQGGVKRGSSGVEGVDAGHGDRG